MLLSVVIQLKALCDGALTKSTGADVHGFWFHHWRSVDPDVADRLHMASRARPFTVSPLMGLPRSHDGKTFITAGTPAWIRITTLTPDLSARMEGEWLPRLPQELPLGGLSWKVVRVILDAAEHPWAARVDLQELVERHLLASGKPERWRIWFVTPAAFHDEGRHLPFPLPERLISSWLRRWWAFGTVPLPEELIPRARHGLAVSAYRLQTVPVQSHEGVTIGCVGEVIMRAIDLAQWERLAIDLLVSYAFWCGTGHRTAQGMGMTMGKAI